MAGFGGFLGQIFSTSPFPGRRSAVGMAIDPQLYGMKDKNSALARARAAMEDASSGGNPLGAMFGGGGGSGSAPDSNLALSIASSKLTGAGDYDTSGVEAVRDVQSGMSKIFDYSPDNSNSPMAPPQSPLLTAIDSAGVLEGTGSSSPADVPPEQSRDLWEYYKGPDTSKIDDDLEARTQRKLEEIEKKRLSNQNWFWTRATANEQAERERAAAMDEYKMGLIQRQRVEGAQPQSKIISTPRGGAVQVRTRPDTNEVIDTTTVIPPDPPKTHTATDPVTKHTWRLDEDDNKLEDITPPEQAAKIDAELERKRKLEEENIRSEIEYRKALAGQASRAGAQSAEKLDPAMVKANEIITKIDDRYDKLAKEAESQGKTPPTLQERDIEKKKRLAPFGLDYIPETGEVVKLGAGVRPSIPAASSGGKGTGRTRIVAVR